MVIAVSVFVLAYILIASERFPRQAVALLGATALVLLNVFPIQEAASFVDWETIGLLFGMFILIMILAEAGFFTWFANVVVIRLRYRPTYVFIVLPLMAAGMAALMDSVTVMLFLSPLTGRIARMIRIDPIPIIAAEVCAANTGGAATLIGNPPNVILGTMLGFNFNDFLAHSAPVSIAATLVLVAMFYLFNRNALSRAEQELKLDASSFRDPGEMITNRRMLKIGLAGFLTAILLMTTHKLPLPWSMMALSPATSALLPALVVVMIGDAETRTIIRKIDIESLLFFIGLFIIVGALQKTEFIAIIAQAIFSVARSSQTVLMTVLYWGSGFTSAVVDNIPMALAMAYVVKNMPDIYTTRLLGMVVWTLALGVGMGGNMTPVGASANVVAYSYLEHNCGKVGWPQWIKMTVPPTLAAMAVGAGLLWAKYLIGWY